MSNSSQTPQDLQLEAYKILVGMLQNDDNLFWRRNDVLIAINGGMLTVIGLMHSSQANVFSGSSKAVSLAICLMGFVVCLFWFLVARRSEAFYNHWYEQLKFLEKQYLDPIKIFQTADEFFSKGHIELGLFNFELDRFARLLRMFVVMQILASFFSVVWLFLGLYLFFF